MGTTTPLRAPRDGHRRVGILARTWDAYWHCWSYRFVRRIRMSGCLGLLCALSRAQLASRRNAWQAVAKSKPSKHDRGRLPIQPVVQHLKLRLLPLCDDGCLQLAQVRPRRRQHIWERLYYTHSMQQQIGLPMCAVSEIQYVISIISKMSVCPLSC